MLLATRQCLHAVLPTFIFALAGTVIFSVAVKNFEHEQRQDLAMETEESQQHLDSLIQHVIGAANKLSTQSTSLDRAVTISKQQMLPEIFQQYLGGITLREWISDKNGHVKYRNAVDLYDYPKIPVSNSQIPSLQILRINNLKHLAFSSPLVNASGFTYGYLTIAMQIDHNFLLFVKGSEPHSLVIGYGDDIIDQLGNTFTDGYQVTLKSTKDSSIWVRLHSKPSIFSDYHIHYMLMALTWLLSITVLSSVFTWRNSRKNIISPLRSISAFLNDDNMPTYPIESLPRNEIGALASTLLKQKREIDQKNTQLQFITERLNRKAAMLKVIAHDLSTPLSVIHMSAEHLKKASHDSSTALIAANRIIVQSQNIEGILTHVKDMKALEAGKRALALDTLTFGPIMKEMEVLFGERLTSKGIHLDWSQDDADTTFVADTISFRMSVLSNIISNAIKFSPRDARIEVRCRRINGMTRIDVRDFGLGIPEHLRKDLFSDDVATTRKGTDGETGTGFGMPLIKFYVELYGGGIKVSSQTAEESAVDHGTLVTLLLKTSIFTINRAAA